QDMFNAVAERSKECDIIIKAAAVADYRPAQVSDEKMKKKDGDLSLALERTTDILKYLGENRVDGQFLCGFSMETQNMLENSRQKLVKKNIDMIAANSLRQQGAGFGVDTNVLTLITADSEKELPMLSKDDAANELLTEILLKMKK
ncbi:MAG: phosphopantothenoylcysteine decarboxylase, partial [Oscillospiraceae bacterium]|nr:phosphopantothenoylcysteine decarboxylase [Oscillospiraceae bacterium]